MCIAGANVADITLLEATIEAVVVERPARAVRSGEEGKAGAEAEDEEHLCLDKAYDKVTGYAVCQRHGYVPHIRRIGEEKFDENKEKKHPARRWVVERTFGWLSRCRGILVRYDKRAECYLALIKLACALLWFRRLFRLERRKEREAQALLK